MAACSDRDWSYRVGAHDAEAAGALENLRGCLDELTGVLPLGEPEVIVCTRFDDGSDVYLAEQRVLTLATPNPMPRFSLWRWLWRH